MDKDCKDKYLSCSKVLVDELDDIQAMILVTKSSCEMKEQEGLYYGAAKDFIIKLSEERNCYIRILGMLSTKIKKVTDLNIYLEQQWVLNKNSDYSS